MGIVIRVQSVLAGAVGQLARERGCEIGIPHLSPPLPHSVLFLGMA